MATSRTDIAYEQRNAVGILTINRPDVLNAFRQSTYQELLGVLEETSRDRTIRALVITGTGRAFCAGEDLKSLDAELSGVMAPEAWIDNRIGRRSENFELVGQPQIVSVRR